MSFIATFFPAQDPIQDQILYLVVIFFGSFNLHSS